MMRLIVCTPVARERFARQLGTLPGVQVRWANPEELPALANEADAMVLSGTVYSPALAEALRQPGCPCQWLQLLTAGYELLMAHGVPTQVVVSNAGSVWSPIVAEHAMALLLALQRRLPQVLAAQAAQAWDNTIRQDMGQLIDSRLVIVGMGSIGAELARRARAFGMSVVGVSRRGRPHPDADEVVALDQLHEALRSADAVAVAVPLSPATTGLIDAAALAACPRHAVIVNVARGPVIDTDALVAALRAGALGGAALDVTDPEPLTPGHPLWALPNVIISPHIGGAAPDRYYERLVRHVVRNVSARLQGAHLNDRINLETP